eukprot:6387899-Pyramimonas_sp.AAC.1
MMLTLSTRGRSPAVPWVCRADGASSSTVALRVPAEVAIAWASVSWQIQRAQDQPMANSP